MPVFDTKITLGNVISAIMIAAGAVGIYVTLQTSLAVQVVTLDNVRDVVTKTGAFVESLDRRVTDLMIAQATQNTRLNALENKAQSKQ
jgi:hypothetical protein